MCKREKLTRIIILFSVLLGLFLFCSCPKSSEESNASDDQANTIEDTTSTGENSIKSESGQYMLHGVNFSPYTRSDQDPNLMSIISEKQIRSHLDILSPYTKWIRTFGSTLGMGKAAQIAHEMNFHTAIGAWLDSDKNTNDKEMQNLIASAKEGYVDLAIVGSEVLYRGDVTVDELIGYIEQFRVEMPNVPVTTAEPYQIWLDHPDLIDHVDVIMSNYYAYWEGISVDEAMTYLNNRYQRVVAKAGGKNVIVSETGWPGNGDVIGQAVADPANAYYYFLNFVSWARANGVDFFYFEAFDEPWKQKYEGTQGANWGIWKSDGTMKEGMANVLAGETLDDNWTTECTPGGSGTPTIEFTHVPTKGTSENLEGEVWHVDTNNYGVAVYIYVGGWWTKPYWNEPVTTISCNGYFVTDITTGGSDSSTSRIAAFLIPIDYDPPAMSGGASLPDKLYDMALDYEIIDR